MRRRLFSVASLLSLLLFVATAVLWASSEWVECYAWAGQPGPRSAVIAFELGHVIVDTSGDWPSGSSWHMAFERLGTHAYRVGVVFRNPRGAAFSEDFNTFGIALLHAKGMLIMPAEAMSPPLPVANIKILRISLAWPVAITAVLPVIFGARWVRKKLRTHRLGHCPCGYNLTGNTSGVCPECGTAIPDKAKA